MSSYCAVAFGDPLHGPYHDTEHGFPASDERVLFERLSLEAFQAGLSWAVVLRKRPGLAAAFAGWEVDAVADFSQAEIDRLTDDPAIIRHRAKIAATVANARAVQRLRAKHGSFRAFLDAHHPQGLAAWVRLLRQHFRFVGPESANEFLMSLGYLPGAHAVDCPVHAAVLAAGPAWRTAEIGGFTAWDQASVLKK